MGNCKSGCSTADLPWTPSRDVTLALLGLDNSGKSTLLANLTGDSTEGLTPTIGFVNSHLEIGNYEVTLYDLGGGPRVRNIWKNYYPEVHGLIFVVDSGSLDRLDEAKEVFSAIAQHEKVKGKPLLIFANKQDLEEAIDDGTIAHRLDLDTVLGDDRVNSSVVKCVALKSATQNRSNPSIKQGVKWLLHSIGEQYDSISERVRADVMEQREIEARQRRERAERVRRIREERERQRVLRGEAGDEDEEEGGASANPFKPITEAAHEAEEKERAAKAAKKAWQEQQARMQAQESSPKVVSPIVSIAESTAHEAMDVTDGRLDEAPCQSAPEGDSAGGATKTSSQRSLQSHASSGLSESSDTLTDVTPRSQGSSDSLHLSASVNSSGQQSTRSHHGVRLEPLHPEVVEKVKKKNRKMLLSRLKNRNKTGPSLESHTETKPTDKQGSHLVSRNTWTAPELETVLPPSDNVPNSSPSLQQGHKDITAILPELPNSKGIKLPPIKLSNAPVGLKGGVLTTEQDVANLPQSSITVLPQPPLPPTEPLITST